MTAEDTNTRAWQIYGRRQLARACTPPVPDRLGWTPWEGIGPGAELLGDITGRRILDIGSGAGHHAVHLAQAHGARVTGIELSPTQYERAVSAHAEVGGVEFVRADVTEYLAGAEPFDAAYAIGTLAFIDPHRSLPALRMGLRPGAPLILSLLHTDLHGRGPSTEVAPREQMILQRDHPPLPTQMWVLAPGCGRTCSPPTAFASRPSTCCHTPTRAPGSSSSSSAPGACPTDGRASPAAPAAPERRPHTRPSASARS